MILTIAKNKKLEMTPAMKPSNVAFGLRINILVLIGKNSETKWSNALCTEMQLKVYTNHIRHRQSESNSPDPPNMNSRALKRVHPSILY